MAGVALGAGAVVLAGTFTATAHRSPRHGPVPQRPASAPAARRPGGARPGALPGTAAAAARLGAQRLFLAEGRITETVSAGGTVLRQLGASQGRPAEPVALGAHIVVYEGAGEAYALDVLTGAGPVPVGAAREVVPAGRGAVALVARSGGRQRVTVLDGALTPTRRVYVAGSDRVVGASATGVLVEAPDGDLDLLGFAGGTVRALTGPVRNLVAFTGDEVAWTSVAGCPLILTSDCPLHLTNLLSGVDRTVRVPGVIGFAPIGAFSPDGRYLAAYALADRPQTSSRLDLVVVATAGTTVRTVASVLDAGSVTPTVTWSATGEWLYFGGTGTFDAVDLAPPAAARTTGRPVPLPLSVSCCVVGF